ncbi:MAG: hypothetical protein AAB581_02300 [Patescibacteria group bacterium]
MASGHADDEKRKISEKGIDLDELQMEAVKLLDLLKNRQPGFSTWNGFLRERLQNLHKLTSQALGK